ncbi:hypothetical protein, partial [Eudoraea sp.]|uniref:hypothetical protein n=1 Tax=Eudoraea sp. TaxID=1979955 RepID=UPI003C71C780
MANSPQIERFVYDRLPEESVPVNENFRKIANDIGALTERNLMAWRGAYVSGESYQKGDVVFGDGWTMTANKDTSEYPFPQTVADSAWAVFG